MAPQASLTFLLFIISCFSASWAVRSRGSADLASSLSDEGLFGNRSDGGEADFDREKFPSLAQSFVDDVLAFYDWSEYPSEKTNQKMKVAVARLFKPAALDRWPAPMVQCLFEVVMKRIARIEPLGFKSFKWFLIHDVLKNPPKFKGIKDTRDMYADVYSNIRDQLIVFSTLSLDSECFRTESARAFPPGSTHRSKAPPPFGGRAPPRGSGGPSPGGGKPTGTSHRPKPPPQSGARAPPRGSGGRPSPGGGKGGNPAAQRQPPKAVEVQVQAAEGLADRLVEKLASIDWKNKRNPDVKAALREMVGGAIVKDFKEKDLECAFYKFMGKFKQKVGDDAQHLKSFYKFHLNLAMHPDKVATEPEDFRNMYSIAFKEIQNFDDESFSLKDRRHYPCK